MTKGICSIADCERPVWARNRCKAHYMLWWKANREIAARRSAEERFWAAVDKTETCWLWTGHKAENGYGRFKLKGKTRPAHRFAYELLVGPIPEGLEPDHLCRVRHCVNPAHLEPVTPRENVRRGDSPSAHNAHKTHCQNGHLFDDANTLVLATGQRRCRACAREKGRQRYADPEYRAANIASNARYVKERMANDPEFRAKRLAYWRERDRRRKHERRRSDRGNPN